MKCSKIPDAENLKAMLGKLYDSFQNVRQQLRNMQLKPGFSGPCTFGIQTRSSSVIDN
jgi:hypothetical protein